MLIVVSRNGQRLIRETLVNQLSDVSYAELIWIDLFCPNDLEKTLVEQYMGISLQTSQQQEEIETSSRYIETEDLIVTNSNFIIQSSGAYVLEPVSFIIKDHILVSMRNYDFRSFIDTAKKMESNSRLFSSGYHLFLSLFETRIDLDADVIENIAREIKLISKKLTTSRKVDETMLLEISAILENTMVIRENIIDKQRIVSSILKSELFPQELISKVRVMIKDIGSLLEYTTFSFERLEYLQDTFMGLINLEQNRIVKIFTVVSVVFMPPTLVASIYGMNFKFMPELDWASGYPYALGVILLSMIVTLFIFYKKKLL